MRYTVYPRGVQEALASAALQFTLCRRAMLDGSTIRNER